MVGEEFAKKLFERLAQTIQAYRDQKAAQQRAADSLVTATEALLNVTRQQADTAAQQAAAAQGLVAPTQQLANSTRTLAWATIALVIVSGVTLLATLSQAYLTNRYVGLTEKLLKVQVDPIVRFDLTSLSADTVEVWNDGFEPVIAMRINPEIITFTGATPGIRYRWSVGPGRDREQSDWWRIDRLSPSDPQRKPIAELAQYWLTHLIDKQKSGTRLIAERQRAAIIFRITYHREVDKKQFSATKIIVVDEVTGPPANKLMYANADHLKWARLSSGTEQAFLGQVDLLSRAP